MEQASLNAQKSRELAPEDPDAFYHFAHIALDKAGKEPNKAKRKVFLDDAEKELRDGLALNPESAHLHRLMGRLRRQQLRSDEALPYFLQAARQLPQSEHERYNVRNALNNLLFEPILVLVLIGVVAQVAGFFLHVGAWATFGAGVFSSLGLALPVGLFPRLALRFIKAFRCLKSDAQATLYQLTADKRKLWSLREGISGFAVAVAVLFNTGPLLLRGLWNMGVWSFHAWKRHH